MTFYTNRSGSLGTAVARAETAAQQAVVRTDPRQMAEMLPPKARKRFHAWQDKAEELGLVSRAASDQTQGAFLELQKAKQELAIVTDPWEAARAGKGLHMAGPAIVKDRAAKVDERQAEYDRLKERLDAAEHRKNKFAGPLKTIDDFLKRVPADISLADYEGKPPALRKDETPITAVERIRKDVATLKADAHVVRSAPFPSRDAKKRLSAQLDELARKSIPNVWHLLDEPEGKIEWQREPIDSQFNAFCAIDGVTHPVRGVVNPSAPFAPGLLALLFREPLQKELERQIDEFADDGAALTADQREGKLAKLAADILKAERQEEHFISEAEGEGLSVDRRADASPLALLQVEEVSNG